MQRLTKHQRKLQARLECFEKRICMAGDLDDFSIEVQSVELSHFAEYRVATDEDRQMESIGSSEDVANKLEIGYTVEDGGEQADSTLDNDPWIKSGKIFEVGNDGPSYSDFEESGKTDDDPFAFSPIDKLIDHDPWLPTESGDSDRDPEVPAVDPPQGSVVVPGDPPNSQDGRSNASQPDPAQPDPAQPDKDQHKPSIQPPPTTSVILGFSGELQGSEQPSSHKQNSLLIANVDGVYASENSLNHSISSLPISPIEAQRFSSIDVGFTTLQETAVEPSSLFEPLPLSSIGSEKKSSTEPPRYFVSRQQANTQVTKLRDSFSDQSRSHIADDAEGMISQAISRDLLDQIVLDGRYRSNRVRSNAIVLVSHIPDAEKSEEGGLDDGNEASDSSTERDREKESNKPAPTNRSFQQLLGMILAGALITFRGSRRVRRNQNIEEKTLHLSRVST